MEKDLWKLSAGEQTRRSVKNRKATYLFSSLDDLAVTPGGPPVARGPIIIETEDDKVLDKAAEYAAQKGYDLASPDPEQNLKIMAKQNAMAGATIEEGSIGPSCTKSAPEVIPDKDEKEKQASLEQLAKDQKDLDNFSQAISFSDDRSVRAKESAEYRIRKAELDEREKGFQEKGWLPAPVVNKQAPVKTKPKAPLQGATPEQSADDIAADIAKIAQQTAALGDPFKSRDGVQPRQLPDQQGGTVQQFPEKVPPEILAHRYGFPAVRDHGNRLVVTHLGMMAVTPGQKRDREGFLTQALLKSRERFGEPVRVTGNPAFEKAVIDLAIAQGIPLEMGSKQGEKAYAKALEAQHRPPKELDAAVQFEPSRNKGITAVKPGKELGLAL